MTSTIIPQATAQEPDLLAAWRHLDLCDAHIQELIDAAWTLEFTEDQNVRTLYSREDLPEEVHWVADQAEARGGSAFPCLQYELRDPSGLIHYQWKPAMPVINKTGDEAKYVFAKDDSVKLIDWWLQVVKDADSTLIDEGTKGSGAAAIYAPANVDVFGIAGINGWSEDGFATEHLSRAVKGRHVVLCPDADAATNWAVYSGISKLGRNAKVMGAKSVKYINLSDFVGGKKSLDEYLASMPESERSERLAALIAEATEKPAAAMPPRPTAAQRAKAAAAKRSRAERLERAVAGIPVVHTHGQPSDVAREIVTAMTSRFGGTKLFNRAGSLVKLTDIGGRPQLTALDKGDAEHFLFESADFVNGSAVEDDPVCLHSACEPTTKVIAAAMSRVDAYPVVRGISTVPLIRPDGEIVFTEGYDQVSQRIVALAPELRKAI